MMICPDQAMPAVEPMP